MPPIFSSRLRASRLELTALALLVPLAVVLGFLLLRFPAVGSPQSPSPAAIPDSPPAAAATSAPASNPQTAFVTLEIAGPGKTVTYRLSAAGDTTVAELLHRAAREQGLKLTTKDFGGTLGIFVEELNGVRNDSRRGTYWTLSVNGKLSDLGASSARVRPEETVRWTYGPELQEPERR